MEGWTRRALIQFTKHAPSHTHSFTRLRLVLLYAAIHLDKEFIHAYIRYLCSVLTISFFPLLFPHLAVQKFIHAVL
jgi:hypothetical protein